MSPKGPLAADKAKGGQLFPFAIFAVFGSN